MKIWNPVITKEDIIASVGGIENYEKLYNEFGFELLKTTYDRNLRAKADIDNFEELRKSSPTLHRRLMEFFGEEHWPIRKRDVRFAVDCGYLRPGLIRNYGKVLHEIAIDWATS